jgi:CubicO group peptidase (beta-lactamase class C family)
MYRWLNSALDYIPQWIEFQMRQSEQPGCVIAIAYKGQIVLEQAFGHADLSSGEPLTPRHRFRVASHSKSFTAAGIMKLREQGKLRLDDAVGRHVDGLHPAMASDVPVADDVPVASGHSGRLPLGRRVVIPGNNPTNALAAATGFVSTAGDLAKFFAALDPAARRTPLTVESRHEMIRRQWRDPHSSIERHYGLGLWRGTTAGWDWFGHGGSFQGFITRTAVFPGYDLSVSILTLGFDPQQLICFERSFDCRTRQAP